MSQELFWLCKCNNCETIMYDENPNHLTPKMVAPKATAHMVQAEDESGFFWACPNCETDANLVDMTSEEVE